MRSMCSAEALEITNRNRVLHSIPEAEANMSIRALRRCPELRRTPRITGAISVDSEGNVNGIDITMPVMNFSETHYFRASKVTTAYKKRLAELTGTVNNGKFKGYAPGEVLFLGASGSRRGKHSDDDWEITFRFAVSPNRENLKIGDLTIKEKLGWDYLWVRYADEVSSDQKSLVKKPESAYVERVYQAADFGGLGIKQ